LTSLTHLSPSQYNAGRLCKARLAWTIDGRRDQLPEHPKALLGTCFHTLMEAAALGQLSQDGEEAIGTRARELFDSAAASAYARTHQLLRIKYQSKEALPYYYLLRERAVVAAINVAARIPARMKVREGARPVRLIEKSLASADGLIVGRPDCIDLVAHEIIDYKTGISFDDAASLSGAELRQLTLYIYLALENRMSVSRAVIVRAAGLRVVAEVPRVAAEAEGRLARQVLSDFNCAAGSTFDSVAQASVEACQFCSCIPFCESFWRGASFTWLEACGTHVEGQIVAITDSQVQGMRLLTIELAVSRGTVSAERAFIEQVPEAWITLGESQLPRVGDVLRVVHGRASSSNSVVVIRVDRTLTSLWPVRGSSNAGFDLISGATPHG